MVVLFGTEEALLWNLCTACDLLTTCGIETLKCRLHDFAHHFAHIATRTPKFSTKALAPAERREEAA